MMMMISCFEKKFFEMINAKLKAISLDLHNEIKISLVFVASLK